MKEMHLTFEPCTIRRADGTELAGWALYRDGVLFGKGTDQTALLAASERQRMLLDPESQMHHRWRASHTSGGRRKRNTERARQRQIEHQKGKI